MESNVSTYLDVHELIMRDRLPVRERRQHVQQVHALLRILVVQRAARPAILWGWVIFQSEFCVLKFCENKAFHRP